MGCNIILNEMNSIESLKLDFNRQQRELGNIHNEKKFDDCSGFRKRESFELTKSRP